MKMPPNRDNRESPLGVSGWSLPLEAQLSVFRLLPAALHLGYLRIDREVGSFCEDLPLNSRPTKQLVLTEWARAAWQAVARPGELVGAHLAGFLKFLYIV